MSIYKRTESELALEQLQEPVVEERDDSDGEDDEDDDEEDTPQEMLIDAAKDGDLEAVRKLLHEHGAAMLDELDDGWAPLHWLATEGEHDACALLVGEGARVDVVGTHGETPLHLAALNGFCGACEQLVRAGASLEAKDEKGWRPLRLAAAADHGDVARAPCSRAPTRPRASTRTAARPRPSARPRRATTRSPRASRAASRARARTARGRRACARARRPCTVRRRRRPRRPRRARGLGALRPELLGVVPADVFGVIAAHWLDTSRGAWLEATWPVESRVWGRVLIRAPRAEARRGTQIDAMAGTAVLFSLSLGFPRALTRGPRRSPRASRQRDDGPRAPGRLATPSAAARRPCARGRSLFALRGRVVPRAAVEDRDAPLRERVDAVALAAPRDRVRQEADRPAVVGGEPAHVRDVAILAPRRRASSTSPRCARRARCARPPPRRARRRRARRPRPRTRRRRPRRAPPSRAPTSARQRTKFIGCWSLGTAQRARERAPGREQARGRLGRPEEHPPHAEERVVVRRRRDGRGGRRGGEAAAAAGASGAASAAALARRGREDARLGAVERHARADDEVVGREHRQRVANPQRVDVGHDDDAPAREERRRDREPRRRHLAVEPRALGQAVADRVARQADRLEERGGRRVEAERQPASRACRSREEDEPVEGDRVEALAHREHDHRRLRGERDGAEQQHKPSSACHSAGQCVMTENLEVETETDSRYSAQDPSRLI